MNKTDLKRLIKPIVKECINEVLIEEGVLSNVVSEVAKGMQGNMIVETPQRPQHPSPASEPEIKKKAAQASQRIQEHRSKMMEAIGSEAYNGVNLFEGTVPAPAQQQATAGASDLGNPTDSGVDISSLIGGASQVWKAMK